jgi:hypothetical protein
LLPPPPFSAVAAEGAVAATDPEPSMSSKMSSSLTAGFYFVLCHTFPDEMNKDGIDLSIVT